LDQAKKIAKDKKKLQEYLTKVSWRFPPWTVIRVSIWNDTRYFPIGSTVVVECYNVDETRL
jgi:hypothetical protein